MDAGGFAMRTGHHCAQPLLEAYGVTSTNRVSFYLYNTMDEAKGFVEHLRAIVEKFG
jgi:cysteine desulfurase/selenocysteine lyase